MYVSRQAMQDKAGRGNEPVTAFFLYPRQTTEELVGDILTKAVVVQFTSRNFQYLCFTVSGQTIFLKVLDTETDDIL
ncbi:hypothetical protein BMS3Bbin11_00123 [bacterium BMS3Bbin11]|nr:hypothetical protein BMS3Bbin11_00123 [bacterium BMS3Bbin11]